ncbi:MAG: prepilin peptidase [Candidatus Peribacteraceae bacterium]|nr:prepilin peptidase [Candidatus Peribacteraceae bacterium]
MSILFFILGLVFGSFGSVLITRVPCGESICGRSGCSGCKKTLTPLELIPLFSYFILRGKCKECKISIGWIYPTVEILSGLLFLFAWILHGAAVSSILLALCLWLLLIIAIIDLYTHSISDVLNIPLLLLAIAYSVNLGHFALSGIALGAGFFGLQWLLSRGKWLGSGDIILGAGTGALLGDWQHMAVCLFLTYIIGGVLASVLLVSGRIKRGQYVAFGPFLALGTVVSIFFQARIDTFIAFYLGI